MKCLFCSLSLPSFVINDEFIKNNDNEPKLAMIQQTSLKNKFYALPKVRFRQNGVIV